jgi:hypothetical protein
MLRYLRLAGACLALCFLVPLTAAAQAPERDRTWFATVYLGQWYSASKPPAGLEVGSPDAGFQDTYFASLQLTRVLARDLQTGSSLFGPVINGSSIELEGQIGQHFGIQDHGEVTLALIWRSRDLSLSPTGGRVNLAIAEGFSYALATPNYEGLANGEDPERFLNYLAFEAEFSHPSFHGVSVVPRVHHRSGIFGLIAPRGSGSDFIGLGLRMTLQ